MASQSRSNAARENGKRSRGPVTPEGKKNAAQNAIKHGLTAESAVLPGESEEDFAELLQSHQDIYKPANTVEKDLVHTLALARWRLRRMAALESSLLENQLAISKDDIDERFDDVSDQCRLAFAFEEQTKSLALLIRYESSLTRLHDRTYKHLKELQQLRNEPKEPARARMPISAPPSDSPVETARSTPSAPVDNRFSPSPAPAGVAGCGPEPA